jgi:hypothetical protein
MEEPVEEEETKEEPQALAEDPAIATYRASGDADMGASAKLSYVHELNILKNNSTANEETNKQIKTTLGENHELVPELSDRDALTIKRPNGDYIIAVRGTRPTNISDLISDEQILLNTKVNRVEKVDKIYNALRQKNPNSKITLTGHSLGSFTAKAIADKYEFKDKKLDMVGFDNPVSPLGVPDLLVQGVAHHLKQHLLAGSEYGNHRIYLTDTFDTISFINKIANYDDDVKILPQRTSRSNWFGSHSIDNYVLEPTKTTAKAYIQKTQQGNKTFYTTPQIQMKKETADFKQDLSDESKDYCSLNPNLSKCKTINKKLI